MLNVSARPPDFDVGNHRLPVQSEMNRDESRRSIAHTARHFIELIPDLYYGSDTVAVALCSDQPKAKPAISGRRVSPHLCALTQNGNRRVEPAVTIKIGDHCAAVSAWCSECRARRPYRVHKSSIVAVHENGIRLLVAITGECLNVIRHVRIGCENVFPSVVIQ